MGSSPRSTFGLKFHNRCLYPDVVVGSLLHSDRELDASVSGDQSSAGGAQEFAGVGHLSHDVVHAHGCVLLSEIFA